MNAEKSYEVIAELALVCSANVEKWDRIIIKSKIYGKMCEIKIYSDDGGSCKALHLPAGKGLVLMSANKGMLFLRDNLLETTNARIWGLCFSLYPDGKFNIEYDYNKPEGYEDTDDVISVSEASDSLKGLKSS